MKHQMSLHQGHGIYFPLFQCVCSVTSNDYYHYSSWYLPFSSNFLQVAFDCFYFWFRLCIPQNVVLLCCFLVIFSQFSLEMDLGTPLLCTKIVPLVSASSLKEGKQNTVSLSSCDRLPQSVQYQQLTFIHFILTERCQIRGKDISFSPRFVRPCSIEIYKTSNTHKKDDSYRSLPLENCHWDHQQIIWKLIVVCKASAKSKGHWCTGLCTQLLFKFRMTLKLQVL